jgi:hypothetical protein
VVLLEEGPGVVREEGANARLGELEDSPASPSGSGEVEVVVRARRCGQVEVVQALRVQVPACVVVDDVDDDGDPV